MSDKIADGQAGTLTVSLHPLIMMNISDHFTRIKSQCGHPEQVFGVLLGKLQGCHVEIVDSFEIVVNTENEYTVDKTFLMNQLDMFKQVFKSLEMVGWYTTGGETDVNDVCIHKQMCEINENPLLLKMDSEKLYPESLVTIYESVMDFLFCDQPRMRFIELPYVLATEEAERIGIDHIIQFNVIEGLNNRSEVANFLQNQNVAVQHVQNRVKMLLDYLHGIKAGMPKHHDILRDINSVCTRLPIMRSEKFTRDLSMQSNDVALVSYLGLITKSLSNLSKYLHKFNIISEKVCSLRRSETMEKSAQARIQPSKLRLSVARKVLAKYASNEEDWVDSDNFENI